MLFIDNITCRIKGELTVGDYLSMIPVDSKRGLELIKKYHSHQFNPEGVRE